MRTYKAAAARAAARGAVSAPDTCGARTRLPRREQQRALAVTGTGAHGAGTRRPQCAQQPTRAATATGRCAARTTKLRRVQQHAHAEMTTGNRSTCAARPRVSNVEVEADALPTPELAKMAD
eukprot:4602427-Pleurochrysis_carterae.AAC.1